jgi:hypothetical protein
MLTNPVWDGRDRMEYQLNGQKISIEWAHFSIGIFCQLQGLLHLKQFSAMNVVHQVREKDR